MVADLRKMQENQGVSENRIDKFGLTGLKNYWNRAFYQLMRQ